MRIDRIETFTRPEVGFVKVTTGGGRFGWGQMSTYHADITATVLHRQVAPWVLGRAIDADNPVADFLGLAALVHEREHKFPGSYVRRASRLIPTKQNETMSVVCVLAARVSRPLLPGHASRLMFQTPPV